jgi:UDP:flavonoid glycosyltransferase YjiC (YdhE family)
VDQFLHGTLVAKHGAGPKSLPIKEWSVDILSERLRELTAITSYRERAQEVAARMAQENGPARALEIVESIIGPP